MKEIKVYSNKQCAACKLVYKFLDSKNITYSIIDIDDNPEEAIKQKIQKLPTVIINDSEKIVGFNPKYLSTILA